MKKSFLQADILLLLTAIIWGFAFVAQRAGMEFIGPFTYNAIRFAIGGATLFPLIRMNEKKTSRVKIENLKNNFFGKFYWLILGLVLFTGASLQQVGIVYTTAGKAGFITGLYVVFVPLLGLLWGQRTGLWLWIAAVITIVGLYLLCITDNFTIETGDLVVLIGAFFWALHVLLISYLAKRIAPIKLAQQQFFICSFLSLCVALVFEKIIWQSIIDAAVPILYGGFISVGIAYTLQVVAQKRAHPVHASVILSSEAVFAAIGGWFLLEEILSVKAIFGCLLILAGMLLAQLGNRNITTFEKNI